MRTRPLWCLLCLVAACGPGGEPLGGLAAGSWEAALALPASSGPGAIVADGQCNAQGLPPGDDSSSDAVALPFALYFYGQRYAQVYVNTNGSLTFERPEGYSIPFRLEAVRQPVIAPFFADVDTRGSGSGRVRYGATTFQGRRAFCVNWLDVGYYRERGDKLNRFQLLLVDRGGTGEGNFDIVMNYGRLAWDSGDASNGNGGTGGASTAAGFSAGSSDPDSLYLAAGSYVPGALLDGEQATGLIWNRRESGIPGRYVFTIREGVLPRLPPVTAGWSSTASLEGVRLKTMHHLVRLYNGRVLAVGGQYPYADVYNPGGGNWNTTGDTREPRRNHTATLLRDGRVLVTGGRGGLASSSAEIYDPTAGTWTLVAPMQQARRHHAAVLLSSGRVLVMGGEDSSDIPLTAAEVYDPPTGMWTQVGSMSSPRMLLTATVLLDGRVLVVGGVAGPPSARQAQASAEVYDPATGTWTSTGSMSTPRYAHTATRLLGGRVLAAGGDGTAEQSASVEVYNPAAGQWAPAQSMLQPRFFHTATLLSSGQVLVAGGYHGTTGVQRSAELYNPETGHWSSAGAMQTERHRHAATLLGDGSVLVLGGISNGDQGSAEVYTPRPPQRD